MFTNTKGRRVISGPWDDVGRRLTAVNMESDSDFEPFEGFSALDIPDTNSDVDWEDDSDSDNDSDVVDFTLTESDSDSHNVWTEELHYISPLPFSQPVGPRHDLSEEASVLDYFSLLLEPDFFNWIA